MSLPKPPSQFQLAKEALRIEKPPNNENWGWSSSPSVGTRSPNSPYVPPVFNRVKSSYASIGKNVPRFRKSRSRKNRSRKNRRANRKTRRN
jgi:hypothetical protein